MMRMCLPKTISWGNVTIVGFEKRLNSEKI